MHACNTVPVPAGFGGQECKKCEKGTFSVGGSTQPCLFCGPSQTSPIGAPSRDFCQVRIKQSAVRGLVQTGDIDRLRSGHHGPCQTSPPTCCCSTASCNVVVCAWCSVRLARVLCRQETPSALFVPSTPISRALWRLQTPARLVKLM